MEIKVVSLNLWHSVLLDDIIAFLRQCDADIVMLQEVSNDPNPGLARQHRAFAVLQKELGYAYGVFAPALERVTTDGNIIEGNAVLSKFPLTGHEPVFFDKPYNIFIDDVAHAPDCPRNLHRVEAKTPVGTVHIINLQGVWDLNGENDSPRRRAMSAAILAEAKGKTRVVVAGDTNAKPTNAAMVAIEDHLTSVFKNELATSFNVKRKDLVKYPGYATATVDIMYVSRDVQVVAHACPDVDISDHLPLTATLRIS